MESTLFSNNGMKFLKSNAQSIFIRASMACEFMTLVCECMISVCECITSVCECDCYVSI